MAHAFNPTPLCLCENRNEAMSLIETVRVKRAEINRLAAAHGAGNVRVFGSAIRGEENPGSDIDVLIDITGHTSAWFPSGLALDLQDLLGRPVDVVTEILALGVARSRSPGGASVVNEDVRGGGRPLLLPGPKPK